MAQRDLVHGIPSIKHTTQDCDVCLIRKHSRAPFLKKAKARSTSPLNLVYRDLCGPITPPSPFGKKYIFLLVDDYSRYMWVYFLSMKDQAFDTFKEYNKSLDFKKCALEQAIYTKTSKYLTLLIGVYVDDIIITGTPKKEIDKLKAQMEEKFEMSDLGLLAYYLGIEVTQTDGDILIKQSAYASIILKEARMLDCNETLIPMDSGTRLTKVTEGTMVNSTEYRSLIGCLRYLLHTRPDLSYSVGLLSCFMQEPREKHMKAIRQVLRYIKGTKGYGITYMHNEGNKIHGFNDSSYGVNTQEGKGTTKIIFYYGESPIS
nr:ribonuclease H-like domain, reverse transcriptase, RNA-dependent DNA polymerase [Tanacetum cinerariifolium]GEX67949.1 ribonuclease H-like domain, reverse transcriptase, RNA-dependent DNA polymerase [Tanacetum cinerariifolium]GEX96225.1 ribonuclease H-like domain, reverse transcriptase, RNA-dependent DNA polymerase [Tanacetum cinerariifolium]